MDRCRYLYNLGHFKQSDGFFVISKDTLNVKNLFKLQYRLSKVVSGKFSLYFGDSKVQKFTAKNENIYHLQFSTKSNLVYHSYLSKSIINLFTKYLYFLLKIK